MPFKPGESGNPKGYKPPRRETLERRELIQNIVDGVLSDPNFIDELNKMKAVDRADIVIKLLPYTLAKLEAESPDSAVPVVSFESEIREKLRKVSG